MRTRSSTWEIFSRLPSMPSILRMKLIPNRKKVEGSMEQSPPPRIHRYRGQTQHPHAKYSLAPLIERVVLICEQETPSPEEAHKPKRPGRPRKYPRVEVQKGLEKIAHYLVTRQVKLEWRTRSFGKSSALDQVLYARINEDDLPRLRRTANRYGLQVKADIEEVLPF